jgi:pantoate--beta-alanine ligase
MGYLHEGHLSLIRKAREFSDFVIVSIFVNPTQFGPGEDYESYPRDFDRDLELCSSAGANAVFAPSTEEAYSRNPSTYVDETNLSKGLCGKTRPEHFRGVVTIVAKLLNMTLPDIAVFGQKDAQQVRVIKRMVKDLDFPVDIIIAPIVRDADGLAMSSRNIYLNEEERKSALSIYASLCLVENKFVNGECNTSVLRESMMKLFSEHPLVEIDYIEFVDDVTLDPVQNIVQDVLVAVAARVGKARLIDNVVLSV